MEKGYYGKIDLSAVEQAPVAIHNKNGKGLLLAYSGDMAYSLVKSQSTIKMEKGYYWKTYCFDAV